MEIAFDRAVLELQGSALATKVLEASAAEVYEYELVFDGKRGWAWML